MKDTVTPGPVSCSLGGLLRYFLKLGTVGFGGPLALVGYMEQDLVEQRKWFSKTDYMQGLALAQLIPGPTATQLAIYLGYIHSGILGATSVGFIFILPSFVMVLAMAMAYVRYGSVQWVHAAFYGVGAAVLSIIIKSAYRLTKATVGNKRLLWALYLIAAAMTVATRSASVWLFLISGMITLYVYAPPKWAPRANFMAFVPVIGWMAPQGQPSASWDTLWKILIFFGKAGTFVFGSGLAIIPFLYGDVVRNFHWLNDRQFLDAVAVAMITPGPMTITVGFIGYLIAGIAGAVMAAIGMYLPAYLFVVILAPWFKKHSGNRQVQAFVQGITAAAIGAMSASVFLLAREAVYDVPTAMILVVTLIAIFRFKLSEPLLVVASGFAGFLLFKG